MTYNVCISCMIYECMSGLLLTLSTTAGTCRSNIVLYLLSIINTEVFDSNTHYAVITVLLSF